MGQKKLLDTIYALPTLPHSILVTGDRGSEEKETMEKIAKHFELAFYDITDLLSNDLIKSILQSTVPTFCYINLANISINNQNLLLKFFEEPTEYIYIALTAEAMENVLPTIVTRSYLFYFDKYTKQELLAKFPNATDEMLSICNTPGQIILAQHANIHNLFTLCELLIKKISEADLKSTLRLAYKINYKDDYDKYDLFLFLRCLSATTLKYMDIESFKIILKYSEHIWLMNDKQNRIELLLLNLWRYKHGLKTIKA